MVTLHTCRDLILYQTYITKTIYVTNVPGMSDYIDHKVASGTSTVTGFFWGGGGIGPPSPKIAPYVHACMHMYNSTTTHNARHKQKAIVCASYMYLNSYYTSSYRGCGDVPSLLFPSPSKPSYIKLSLY